MKKITKKIISILLVATTALSVSSFSMGCGSEDDPNTLYISIIDKGYGTQWIDTMMNKFLSSNEKYSEYKYELINSMDDETTKTEIEENTDNYDLVIHGGSSDLVDNKYLTDLTSVYEQIGDKMDNSIKSSFVRGNSYYTIPWVAGGSGLIVNYDIVNAKLGNNWEQTYKCRTTNEFITFVNALKSVGVVPFVLTTDKDFYGPLATTWWAQYEGLDGVKDFYEAKYEDVNGFTREGKEAMMQDGILESLLVMEQLINHYYDKPEDKSKNNYVLYQNFVSMQTAYMEGKSAMIVNGPWMLHEQTVKTTHDEIDMRFIKTPIISSLATKLEISEDKLIEIIDYVDGVTIEKPNGVSDKIIDTVTVARRTVVDNIDALAMFVPSNSIKKEIAVDFIKWMYSDEGHAEYVSATNGLFLPISNNINTELNAFASTHKKMTENAIRIFPNKSWKFAKAGISPFAVLLDKASIEYLLTNKSGAKDGETELNNANAIYEYNLSYYDINWNTILSKAK